MGNVSNKKSSSEHTPSVFSIKLRDAFVPKGTEVFIPESICSFILNETIPVIIPEEHPLFDENRIYCYCPNVEQLFSDIKYNLFVIPKGTKINIDNNISTRLYKDISAFVNKLVIPLEDKSIMLCDKCRFAIWSGVTPKTWHLNTNRSRYSFVGYNAVREYHFIQS